MKSTLYISHFLFFVFLLTFSTTGRSENPSVPLSPVALYERCYGDLVQEKPAANDPGRVAVLAGAYWVDECMSIFDSASLKVKGDPNEGYLNSDTPLGRKVLRTFNDFHRNWFPNDQMVASSPGEFAAANNAALHDATEAALHITRTLFSNGVSYSDVVTGTSVVEALRSNGVKNNVGFQVRYNSYGTITNQLANFVSAANPSVTIDQLYSTDPASSTGTGPGGVVIQTDLVQTGNLVGVRNINGLNPRKQNAHGYAVDDYYYNFANPIYLNQSQGGGIIGTPSYLLLNLGLHTTQGSDGGLMVARRWAKALMHDLMCRDVPAIRPGDAAPFVETKVTPATPPFRISQTCMTCHETMDSIAYTARNVTYAYMPMPYFDTSGTAFGFSDPTSVHIYPWPVASPVAAAQVDSDPAFYLRPPTGKLYYRDYKGDLIAQPVMGISGLGQALAATDDLYMCAASRYFQFFTGIKVNLQDPGDPSSVTLTAAEKVYHDAVVSLGSSLKSNQTLRALIQNIFESPYYQTVSRH